MVSSVLQLTTETVMICTNTKKDGSVAMGADGEPKPKTSHSLNPVPGIIYDPEYKGEYELELNEGLGISSWPSTLMMLMGFVPPTDYDKSMLNLK